MSVNLQGDLLFYDFGMMGEIVGDVRLRLLDLFYGTYRKDVTMVGQAGLPTLKSIPPAPTGGSKACPPGTIPCTVESGTPHVALGPLPLTLSPSPSPQRSLPSTLNPRPSTLGPSSSTLSPRPSPSALSNSSPPPLFPSPPPPRFFRR